MKNMILPTLLLCACLTLLSGCATAMTWQQATGRSFPDICKKTDEAHPFCIFFLPLAITIDALAAPVEYPLVKGWSNIH